MKNLPLLLIFGYFASSFAQPSPLSPLNFGQPTDEDNLLYCLYPNEDIKTYEQKDRLPDKNIFKPHLTTRSDKTAPSAPDVRNRSCPAELQDNQRPPKVVITGFEILNKPEPIKNSKVNTLRWQSPLAWDIASTKNLTLHHWQNDFSFKLAAPDLADPENNHYQYMLEGHDTGWIETDAADQKINYSNLEWKEYTFKVRGFNNNGYFGETATIHLTILPPWWATWWAKLFYGALIIGVLYFFRNYELRRQFAQNKTLRLAELNSTISRLDTHVVHEFRNILTIILSLTDQFEKQPGDSIKTNLEVIQKNGPQLLQLINQILDLSTPHKGSSAIHQHEASMMAYLHHLAKSFHLMAKENGMGLHFNSSKGNTEVNMNLQLLFRPAPRPHHVGLLKLANLTKPAEMAFIQKVQDVVETHLDDTTFSIPMLCRKIGMSRTQFHRKITNLTGQSASRFALLIRLSRAKEMLMKDELTISEISYQVGFSNPDYFSKVFKKETGQSPSSFRQNA